MGDKASVCISVLFGGWWACQGRTWVFNGTKSQKVVVVVESIDYVSLKKMLMEKFKVDGTRYDVQLTYVKPKKEGGRPFAIGDAEDLHAFKFVNSLSGDRSWPIDLHVSLQNKVGGEAPSTQGSTTRDSVGVGISSSGCDDVVLPLTGPPVTRKITQ